MEKSTCQGTKKTLCSTHRGIMDRSPGPDRNSLSPVRTARGVPEVVWKLRGTGVPGCRPGQAVSYVCASYISCVCAHMYVHVCVHMCASVDVFVCMYKYVYVHMCMCVHICAMYVCTHMCIGMCIHMCMQVCVCTHMCYTNQRTISSILPQYICLVVL